MSASAREGGASAAVYAREGAAHTSNLSEHLHDSRANRRDCVSTHLREVRAQRYIGAGATDGCYSEGDVSVAGRAVVNTEASGVPAARRGPCEPDLLGVTALRQDLHRRH